MAAISPADNVVTTEISCSRREDYQCTGKILLISFQACGFVIMLLLAEIDICA
jgi:hypothetical protein